MSVVGTFAVMYLLGYSLDNLSLMALTLSVGFVVDDAIVVLENIVRHIEMGERPFEAALTGSREISFTVVSMTISLAAVFIPILFMGGILGRLFNEFAVTIAAAVLISGFVSLTLTPMLCEPVPAGPRRRSTTAGSSPLTERVFQRSLDWYEAGLRWSLRHRLAVVGLILVVQAATVWHVRRDPQGVHPEHRHGTDLRLHRGGRGDLVRVAGAAPAGGGGDRREEPERRRVHVDRGRRAAASGAATPASSSSGSSRAPSGRTTSTR